MSKSFIFETKTGVIAHRGSHIKAPENTLKAIELAGRLGYEMVELDVQRTSDDVYVLMHDATVDRTTDGSGTLRNMTYAEVQSLIVYESYVGKTSDDEIIRVPAFEEACRECEKWGLGINVDGSKLIWDAEKLAHVVTLLKRYNLWDKSFFVLAKSEDRSTLTRLFPDAHVTWLSSDRDPTNNINECRKYKNAFVSYSSSAITDDLIEAYKRFNIPVFVYACNKVEELNHYIAKGVRFVETDTLLPPQS